jgi:hypothetical protein
MGKVRWEDHNMTMEITCPWCGHKQSDSWDFNLEDGETTEIECDCGHAYKAECSITVDYSTTKIEDTP